MMRGSFEKWLLFSLVLLVPGLFFANVWQSYRYAQIERDVVAVHDEHLQVIEENRRLIVGISGLRSPSRIRLLAEEELGLAPIDADGVRRIDTGEAGDGW